MSTTTGTFPGVRIVDMPDLGTVNDSSSVVGERAGSGRFAAAAMKSYVLAGTTTGAYASIAALRANASTFYQGALVAGYAAPADGGGGAFSLAATDTTTADNGGTIIVDAAHQRWYRHDVAAGLNVRWFGAKGDGTTNATAAFNAASAAAAALGGGTVVVPVGRYLVDPISLPAFVSLSGAVPGPFDPANMTTNYAPTLLVNSTASVFLTLGQDCTLSDVMIYYPQQVPPSASAPNVYPFCVKIASTCRVLRCTLVNPYLGIDVQCGRSVIEDCKLGSLMIGINVDNCLDTVTINRCWIGQYFETAIGQIPFQPLDTWNLTNGRCIVVGRVDGLYIDQLACGGRQVALYLTDGTGTGLRCGYGKISNVDIDTVQYGVSCFAANNSAGGYQISNMVVGLWGTTGGDSTGISYLSLGSGGSQAPMVSWNGGSVRGAFTTGTKGMQIGAGSAWISNVRGYNPLGMVGPPAMPATSTTFYNPYPVHCRVFLTGIGGIGLQSVGPGTLTNVGVANPQFVTLGPGEYLSLTYTGTPSWTWFGE